MVRTKLQQLNSYLSKEQTHILEAAVTLMVPVFLGKVMGQVFTLLAASIFGTENTGWNNFILANAIPELLTTVLLVGTVGSVIIPTLITSRKNETNEKFLNIYSSIINISMLVFIFFSVILIFGAHDILPFLIDLVADPINKPSATDMNQIVQMMRVLLIPQIILGASVFVSSGLNVYNRFVIPQYAGVFYNIGRILAVVTLVPLMDYSPWAMVWGTLIGSILHLAIQLPLFFNLGLRYKAVIDLKNDYIKEILVLGGPRVFALASEHIAFAFNKFLAYGVSGIASLTYANSLSLVIPSLFGYTFSNASYPTLAKLFIEKNYSEINSIVVKTLNEILFLSLPCTIIFMVLRVPIVRLSFGILPGTNFTLDSTYQVAWILLWFSVGWVFVSGRWFVYRLFYAAKDTLTPLLVSVISLVVTIVLSIAFTNLFSHNETYAVFDTHLNINYLFDKSTGSAAVGGIALAMSIAYSIEFFVMLYIFHKYKVNISLRIFVRNSLNKFIAGGTMLVVMYMVYKTWNTLTYVLPDRAHFEYAGSTTINLLLLTSVTVATGLAIYILMCLLLKVEELKIFRKYLNPILRFGGLRIRD